MTPNEQYVVNSIYPILELNKVLLIFIENDLEENFIKGHLMSKYKMHNPITILNATKFKKDIINSNEFIIIIAKQNKTSINILKLLSKVSTECYLYRNINNNIHYIYLFSITKQKTNDIIYNNIEYVENFIRNILYNKYFSYHSIKMNLFKKKNYYFDRILKDINYLRANNILTSRLGIFIYKICTFDFNTSDTAIGKDFAKLFSKSKNYNCNKYEIKNTKGYFVTNMPDTKEIYIRLQIADNLYYEEKCQDLQMISRVVGVEISVLRQKYNV